MKVEDKAVRLLQVTDIDEPDGCGKLDPIDIIIENHRPGVGEITIKCFGRSWTARWGAMSGMTVEEFVLDSDVWYLAKNFCPMLEAERRVESPDWHDCLLAEIIRMRQDKSWIFIEAADAREKWNKVKQHQADWGELNPDRDDEDAAFIEDILEDTWWDHVPMEPNPEYEYLLRIVSAVKQALKAVA